MCEYNNVWQVQQQSQLVSWTVTSISSGHNSQVLSFRTVFSPGERMKSVRLDTTVVLDGNSSH